MTQVNEVTALKEHGFDILVSKHEAEMNSIFGCT